MNATLQSTVKKFTTQSNGSSRLVPEARATHGRTLHEACVGLTVPIQTEW